MAGRRGTHGHMMRGQKRGKRRTLSEGKGAFCEKEGGGENGERLLKSCSLRISNGGTERRGVHIRKIGKTRCTGEVKGVEKKKGRQQQDGGENSHVIATTRMTRGWGKRRRTSLF